MNPNDPNVLRVPGLVAFDELYQSRIEAIRTRISAIAGLKTL